MGKPNEKSLDKTAYLAGQVGALRTFIVALMRTHADANALEREYRDLALKESFASEGGLGLRAQEDYLAGQIEESNSLHSAISAYVSEQAK